MKKRTEPTIIDRTEEELQEILQRAQQRLDQEDFQVLQAIVESYRYLTDELGKKRVALRRLQKLLFGARTEKTDAILEEVTDARSSGVVDSDASAESTEPIGSEGPKKPKGHGRNGADAYTAAEKVPVSHPSLEAGDDCPECGQGTLYRMPPKVLIRLRGQAPVSAKRYEQQRLRCGLCGKIFTAPLPEDAGSQKCDVTTGSIIGVLKYGSGMPFNRLEGLQGGFGVPLPASTQWDIIAKVFVEIEPAYLELIRQAAQGEVLYNDDTTIKILELIGKRAQKKAAAEDDQEAAHPKGSGNPSKSSRTGLFTSGIVSTQQDRKIALFFSGRNHAGENLAEVLAERAAALAAPLQMCDALSRNLPGELATIVANCLAHARRRFVDVTEAFPTESRHVLEALKVIYRNDALAREQHLSPEARLHFHQAESQSTMEELHTWLNRQFEERLVEPNSAIGEAIRFMMKHWQKLTLFLREAGAPLDNNICERALKRAILHRKNSLFFASEKGARAADVFMSLIHTCELCGANPFEYLTELQRHAEQLASSPQTWMPWNYRATLELAYAPPATVN